MLKYLRTPVLICVLLFFSGSLYAQKRPAIGPIPSFGYFHQGTNNYFFSLGAGHLFKRHSFIALLGGPVFFRNGGTKYISPNITLKAFYQFDLKKIGLGPIIDVNYTTYKIHGLRDNYLSFDAGILINGITIFGGYNYNLDKKDLNQITPYRIGIRFI